MCLTGEPDARKPARPVRGGTHGKGTSNWNLARRLPYYVSIQVEIKRPLPPPREPVVGVDVGLKQSAVVSDGRRLENQKPLALHLRKHGKLQRKLSKKQKTKDTETKRTVFSKNYLKQREKVARKHQQIANIRRNVQHKFTTELAQTCGTIGLEDLNILGMMQSRSLARAVAD